MRDVLEFILFFSLLLSSWLIDFYFLFRTQVDIPSSWKPRFPFFEQADNVYDMFSLTFIRRG